MAFGEQKTQGFGNPGDIIANKVVIEGPKGGLFMYATAAPQLGSLIASDFALSNQFDSVGNALVEGRASYTGNGSTWFANSLMGGSLAYFFATSPAGPWQLTAQIFAQSGGFVDLNLVKDTVNGVIPQPLSGITTVAQVVAALKAMGLGF